MIAAPRVTELVESVFYLRNDEAEVCLEPMGKSLNSDERQSPT